MGEIREKVLLTNALDEMLARRGQLAPERIRKLELNAIVDTGAIRSVLPIHVVEELGLQIRGQIVARYAHGRYESVEMTEPVIFRCQTRETLEEALVLGDEVLIGRTIPAKLDLVADCVGQRLMPHPDRPNQPVSMVR